jgi:hypothetical protein
MPAFMAGKRDDLRVLLTIAQPLSLAVYVDAAIPQSCRGIVPAVRPFPKIMA